MKIPPTQWRGRTSVISGLIKVSIISTRPVGLLVVSAQFDLGEKSVRNIDIVVVSYMTPLAGYVDECALWR